MNEDDFKEFATRELLESSQLCKQMRRQAVGESASRIHENARGAERKKKSERNGAGAAQ